jgi:putative transposase
MRRHDLVSLLTIDLDRMLPRAELVAYCLMPNHFHLILKEVRPGGIATYMQKILTGYTMYFNKKYERTGALLSGTFKSKHLYDDRYLKHAISYVHLNPAELFEHDWKKGTGDIGRIEEKLLGYTYSSLLDFHGIGRPEHILLNADLESLFDAKPSLSAMLAEAQEYYEATRIKV